MFDNFSSTLDSSSASVELDSRARFFSCVLFSLRRKRFGKAFRTFDALFAFLAAGKLGRGQKSAPQFLRSQNKSEKRLQRAESPTETLATQAMFYSA